MKTWSIVDETHLWKANPTKVTGAQLRAALDALGLDDHGTITAVFMTGRTVQITRFRGLSDDLDALNETLVIDVDWSKRAKDHYRRLASDAKRAEAAALRAEVAQLRARLDLQEPVIAAARARTKAGQFTPGATFDDVVNASYAASTVLTAAVHALDAAESSVDGAS